MYCIATVLKEFFMKLEREMMRGAGPTAVMHLLSGDEMYGYEIVERLGKESAGVFEMGQSTLYPMLYNLEGKGLVKSREKKGDNGRKRRYYRLTAKGSRKLEADRKQWTSLIDGLSALGVTRVSSPVPCLS
ncbi:PadR family transcriptional regulator, partial [Mariniblastus sp.]|nr:PadR family transcriptional regulator [Mariniblastus sp.]